jgi:hypothetical protein
MLNLPFIIEEIVIFSKLLFFKIWFYCAGFCYFLYTFYEASVNIFFLSFTKIKCKSSFLFLLFYVNLEILFSLFVCDLNFKLVHFFDISAVEYLFFAVNDDFLVK